MITDKRFVGLAIFMALGVNLRLQAQFLDIRIHIPAGVNFSHDSPRKVINGIAGNTQQEITPITWIAMEAMENLSFLVSLENQEPDQDQLPTGYYLNHQIWDLSEVVELFPGINQLTIDSRKLLIRNINPKISTLQAWLGIPTDKPIHIKIEYP